MLTDHISTIPQSDMSIFFLTLDKEPDLEKKETPGFFLWIKSGGKRGAKWEAYRKKGLAVWCLPNP